MFVPAPCVCIVDSDVYNSFSQARSGRACRDLPERYFGNGMLSRDLYSECQPRGAKVDAVIGGSWSTLPNPVTERCFWSSDGGLQKLAV